MSIDQDWLIEWSMSRPLPGSSHNQPFLKIKEENYAEDDEHDTNLIFDGASPNPRGAATRYLLPEETTIEIWEQDPDTGEWLQRGIEKARL